jgi:hypothetical protein
VHVANMSGVRNAVEPGYDNIGLYDTSIIVRFSTVPINS